MKPIGGHKTHKIFANTHKDLVEEEGKRRRVVTKSRFVQERCEESTGDAEEVFYPNLSLARRHHLAHTRCVRCVLCAIIDHHTRYCLAFCIQHVNQHSRNSPLVKRILNPSSEHRKLLHEYGMARRQETATRRYTDTIFCGLSWQLGTLSSSTPTGINKINILVHLHTGLVFFGHRREEVV